MLKRSLLNRELWAAFLLSRAVFLVAAVVTPLLVGHLNAEQIAWPDSSGWYALFHGAWFTADSGWYEGIVRHGYEHRPFSSDRQANWGFFPLFPILVWLFGGTFWSGFVISNVAAFVGLAAIHTIAQRLRGDEVAGRVVKLMCFFPISFVLSSYRPEGLFLLLSALVYLALLDDRYWLAAGWGFLMGLTRSQSIVVVGLIGFEALRRRNFRPSVQLLAAGTPLAGIAAVSVYDWRITGDPLAWAHIQEIAWGNHPTFPLGTLARELMHPALMEQWGWSFAPFNLIVAVAWLAAGLFLLRGVTMGLGLYTLASLMFPLTAGGVAGVGRYVLPVFGVFFVWAGKPERRLGYELLLALFAGLLGLWGALLSLGVHSATG